MKKAAVILGSDSDLKLAEDAFSVFEAYGIPYEKHIFSAHRTPDEAAAFASQAREKGFGVLIAGAGMAAHLAGALAARTTLPVIGIPLAAGPFQGMDALFSTVQMPSGIPVATVGVNGAKNAALLAAEILSLEDDGLAQKLQDARAEMRNTVLLEDQKLQG
ncbi:MAG: 5-(carboxyamino)imidazole ribonucleotide mutase [Clostridia bacterium]|nr:5-(carboxyamino)imidazole ribonucleotide mutase [Clostridia bacterium]